VTGRRFPRIRQIPAENGFSAGLAQSPPSPIPFNVRDDQRRIASARRSLSRRCTRLSGDRIESRRSRIYGGRDLVAPSRLGLDRLRRYLQGLPVTERTDFEPV